MTMSSRRIRRHARCSHVREPLLRNDLSSGPMASCSTRTKACCTILARRASSLVRGHAVAWWLRNTVTPCKKICILFQLPKRVLATVAATESATDMY